MKKNVSNGFVEAILDQVSDMFRLVKDENGAYLIFAGEEEGLVRLIAVLDSSDLNEEQVAFVNEIKEAMAL